MTVLTLTLSISAYAPGANAISGGRVMANGHAPHWGAFACPHWVRFGSEVELIGAARVRAERMGMPVRGACVDRFAKKYSNGFLDICIPQRHLGMTNGERLRMAMTWGRVSGEVVIRTPAKHTKREP